MEPLNLLGQDAQNEVQYDFLWSCNAIGTDLGITLCIKNGAIAVL